LLFRFLPETRINAKGFANGKFERVSIPTGIDGSTSGALAFDDGSTKAPVQPAQSASEEQPDISGDGLSDGEETV